MEEVNEEEKSVGEHVIEEELAAGNDGAIPEEDQHVESPEEKVQVEDEQILENIVNEEGGNEIEAGSDRNDDEQMKFLESISGHEEHFEEEGEEGRHEILERKVVKTKRKGMIPHSAIGERDFLVEDPSFLDEFDSSVEEVLKAVVDEEEVEEVLEEIETSSDEDKYAIYKCASPPVDDVYDQICDVTSTESTDSHFDSSLNMVQTKVRPKEDQEIFRFPPELLLKEKAFVKTSVSPDLILGMAEAAVYQPEDPLEYISHYLSRCTKSREELGMDPDPRDIQEVVDRHERELERLRARSRVRKVPSESSESGREPPEKEEVFASTSHLGDLRKKYKEGADLARNVKKQKRLKIPPRELSCIGPTTLVGGFYLN